MAHRIIKLCSLPSNQIFFYQKFMLFFSFYPQCERLPIKRVAIISFQILIDIHTVIINNNQFVRPKLQLIQFNLKSL